MTRIVAGRFGGRRIAVPPSGTRPTSDRAREGLFSTLGSLLVGFDGIAVLDLYAGSGAVGLEAWSRGAARVVLVESSPRAVEVLRANVASLQTDAGAGTGTDDGTGTGAVVTVVASKVESAVREILSPSGFDLVFADPPYALASSELAAVIETVCNRGLLAAGAIIAVERGSRESWNWPEGIEPLRERRYGDAQVWYGSGTVAPPGHS
ncbi:MAG: 16S rRNA (guanine(966)-N(2))-methyltransferase RsmD [Acidothermaceae bacterium]